MEYLPLIGTVTLIHLLSVMSPGPDLIVAIRNSLVYSRKTGVWTAVGFSLGILIHISYCVAGLALVISQSIILFNIFKFLGAGYLIFIGLKSFFSKSSEIVVEKEEKKKDISALKAVQIGFLTNVLNPKATLYFLSLFTLVISPETPLSVLVILSMIMVLIMGSWFSLVAFFLTQKKVQKTFGKFQKSFNRVFGGLLVSLGIKVALGE